MNSQEGSGDDSNSGTKMIKFPSSSPMGNSNETRGVFSGDVEPPFRLKGNVFFCSTGLVGLRPRNLRD